MAALGIKLNNPCNIRYNPLNHWKGQIGQYKGFCRFSSVDYGIRAVLSILRTYRYKYGLDTIRKIISRYAPPSENHTDAYINYVVTCCNTYGYNITADTPLNLDFYDYKGICPLFCIVVAICYVETKYLFYSADFERCLKLLHF